jgi:cytochrome c553
MRPGRLLLVLGALASGSVFADPIDPAITPQQNYVLRCQGCHGPEGRGVQGRVPPLADTFGSLVQVPAGRDYLMRVPGASNSALSDAALAAVLNWLVQQYSTPEVALAVPPYTAGDVASGRHRPLPSVRGARNAVIAQLADRGIAVAREY